MASALAELNGLLEKSKTQIARALPRHLTAERMMRVAMTAYSKTPGLQKCTPVSIVGCVVQASEMGLELTGPLGHAYMVPRWNKNIRGTEANFQIGYRGFIDLAYRSGRVKTFCAHEVRAGDSFDYQFGSDPFVTHRPAASGRGEVTHVYAVCLQTNGGIDFEVMSADDINEHAAKYSDAADKDYSPWKTAWVEMAKKTVIRKIAKRIPLSIEFAKAATVDEYHEAGIKLPDELPTPKNLDEEILGEPPAPPTNGNGHANRITDSSKAPEQPPPPSGSEPSGSDPDDDNIEAFDTDREIGSKIFAATSVHELTTIGAELKAAKPLIGDVRHGKRLAEYQAKFKALGGK